LRIEIGNVKNKRKPAKTTTKISELSGINPTTIKQETEKQRNKKTERQIIET
jgi:hypothetical protein